MYNRIILIGRLTREPELRYTPGGSAVTNMRIAVGERRRDRNGQLHTDTLFIDVTVWGNQAEVVARYLRKGRLVLVDGQLRMETWQDRDGNKRTTYRVVARQVRFLDGAGAQTGEQPAAGTQELAEEPAAYDVPPPPPTDEPGADDIPF